MIDNQWYPHTLSTKKSAMFTVSSWIVARSRTFGDFPFIMMATFPIISPYPQENPDLSWRNPWHPPWKSSTHRVHVWYIYIYANIKGVYWWDPWHTIYSSTMDPWWAIHPPFPLLKSMGLQAPMAAISEEEWMVLKASSRPGVQIW